MILATAILIPLHQPFTHVGLLVTTQLLVGIGSSFFTACSQLANMALVTHQEIAVVLAIWGMFDSVGSSVGSNLAGGIWNNMFLPTLHGNLPDTSKDQSAAIFGDMVIQMSYTDSDPERDAIVDTYTYVQMSILIAGVANMPLTVLPVFMWKNINVKISHPLNELAGIGADNTVGKFQHAPSYGVWTDSCMFHIASKRFRSGRVVVKWLR